MNFGAFHSLVSTLFGHITTCTDLAELAVAP